MLPLTIAPSFTGGNAGPADATGGSQGTPLSLPFVFDNSGWNISVRSTGSLSAQGSSGAASGTGSGAGVGAGAGPGGSIAGLPIPLLLLIAGAWLLLKK